ncbi:MAG: hypothetical protein BMS9Abin21_163 [Thermodesulfovibrionia bacterium]|nr:MAG: hypothetical protein BMS9Abin21_163 [Thermodesulfovibrionia bacterium]
MKKTCITLIIFVSIFLGCSSKAKVKPSADSKLTIEALNSIDTLKTAYEGKDWDAFRSRLAPVLTRKISKEPSFEKTELSFSPRMVDINNSDVMVSLNWMGEWVISGKEKRDRGVAVFVFEGTPLKLIRIDGDNPFYLLIINAEQTSDTTIREPSNPEQNEQADKMETQETTEGKALKDDEASNPGHLQTETVKKGNKNYSVQVGAWRNAEYAEETLNKLKPHYPDAYIAVENNFSKIRIPGIITKKQGELIINNIKEKLNLNPILIRGSKN